MVAAGDTCLPALRISTHHDVVVTLHNVRGLHTSRWSGVQEAIFRDTGAKHSLPIGGEHNLA